MGNENNSISLKENEQKEKMISPVNLRKSIKSNYIIQDIFSFLYEKKKLKIIIYNKKYQDLFRINLNHYKQISGKRHVGSRNGKGKEYLLEPKKLVFEGEYLNGKKNGKGKEYYDYKKIKFEGEYLNGIKIEGKGYDEEGNLILKLKKDGKAKEYYNDKKIKFEGEYFNGKRWNGKLYNYFGEIEIYFKYGYGKGKEYDYYGELIFEG